MLANGLVLVVTDCFLLQLTTLLKNKYSSLKEAVRRQLSQAQWVSITLDLTSVTSKGYFIVSGHFVGKYSNCSLIEL